MFDSVDYYVLTSDINKSEDNEYVVWHISLYMKSEKILFNNIS